MPRPKKSSVEVISSQNDEDNFNSDIIAGEQSIQDSFDERYGTYAKTVISSRAIPNIEDGLLPVMRRYLYTMHGMNIPFPAYKKSAAFVGNTLSSFHPHGDNSVYDSMINMAKTFVRLNPLIDLQGNGGSPNGDSAAAMRYTETRLSKFAKDVYFKEFNLDLVRTMPNFDASLKEPCYLPAAFPMFLSTGIEGIATGFTSDMPTHRLSDILETAKKYIANPNIRDIDLAKDLRPDFPLGATIVNEAELPAMYANGKGTIKVKATVDIENYKGKEVLVIKDLPQNVTLKSIREKLAEDMKADSNKKETKKSVFIDKISEMYDDSSIKVPIRFIIVPKRGTDINVLMNLLYSETLLTKTINYSSTVLNGDNLIVNPSLTKLFEMWFEYRINFIKRRTNNVIRKTSETLYLKKALSKAHANLDAVIKIIRNSKSEEDSIGKLRKLLTIAAREAKYIVSIRFQQIANVEKDKLANEIEDLDNKIQEQIAILADRDNVINIIINEMEDVVKKYNTPARLTNLTNDGSTGNKSDARLFIEKEDIVIGISTDNYIYTHKLAELRETKRRTKGSLFIPNKYNKTLKNLYTISNHDDICIFTTDGKLFKAKGYELDAFHKPIGTMLEHINSRNIAAIVPITEKDFDKYFVFISKLGFMKRVPVDEIVSSSRSTGLMIWKPSSATPEDILVDVGLNFSEIDNVLTCLTTGYAMRMKAGDIPVCNRNSVGRAMMKLRNEDEQVVNMDIAKKDIHDKVFVICTNSRGKLVDIETIPARSEKLGRKVGKKIMSMEKGDIMVGGRMVSDSDRVLVNVSSNKTIKVAVSEISTYSRVAKGMSIVNIENDESVVSVAVGNDVEEILED